MDKTLEQAILDTVSYFDIFDYPLTHFEIYTFLFLEQQKKYSFDKIFACVSLSNSLGKKLFKKNGFVGLLGREELLTLRQRRYIVSHDKYRIVSRFANIAKHIPFIEVIATCNNLSFHNAKRESDLDFFIVTKKGMVSVVRFISVIIAMLFFKRPTSKHHRDTVCLSFFVDAVHQNIGELSFANRDIYMTYWYATLQPLFFRSQKVYDDMESDNKQLLSYIPNHLSRASTVLTRIGVSRFRFTMERTWKFFSLNFLVSWLYTFQLRRLPQAISASMNKSTSVVVTSSIFKTHSKDIRQKIYDRWIIKKSC